MKRITLIGLLLLQACSVSTIEGKPGKYRDYDVRISDGEGAECFPTGSSAIASGLAHANRARAARGLPSLTPDPALILIAAQQACTMAKAGTMTHAGTREEGPKDRAKSVGYQPRVIAENIAAGPYDVNQASSQWSASSAHLANILLPQTKNFGIGSARGGDGTVYWAAVYATRK